MDLQPFWDVLDKHWGGFGADASGVFEGSVDQDSDESQPIEKEMLAIEDGSVFEDEQGVGETVPISPDNSVPVGEDIAEKHDQHPVWHPADSGPKGEPSEPAAVVEKAVLVSPNPGSGSCEATLQKIQLRKEILRPGQTSMNILSFNHPNLHTKAYFLSSSLPQSKK